MEPVVKQMEEEAIDKTLQIIQRKVKKASKEWNKQDFKAFLEIIEFSMITESGIKTVQDFQSISNDNYKKDFNITSIMLKKVLLWQKLIQKYDGLVGKQERQDLSMTLQFTKTKFEDVPQIQNKKSMECINNEEIPFNSKETCILLRFKHDNAPYQIPSEGGKFGRSEENDIVLSDPDISRKHAEIFFLDNKFYLKDFKSSMGTLIRLTKEPVVLDKNMKFEIGNYYKIVIQDVKGLKIKLKVENENDEDYENQKEQELDFAKIGINKGVIIGKSLESHIRLPAKKKSKIEDKHCMIYCNEKDQVVLSDQLSESGTWLFLDQIPRELLPKMQFRLGERCIFEVVKIFIIQKSNIYLLNEDETPNPNEEANKGFNELEDVCIICCENQKNATLLPCKHNFMCVKCSQGLRICPMCRKPIEGILEIKQ